MNHDLGAIDSLRILYQADANALHADKDSLTGESIVRCFFRSIISHTRCVCVCF
jgi:hypothetical protein